MVRGANLGLRFLLELASLGAVAWCGWEIGNSTAAQVLLAIVFPLVFALVWGTFIAPKAPVQLPRVVWYGLQVVLFGGAALALASVWSAWAGIVFAVVVAANLVVLAVTKG